MSRVFIFIIGIILFFFSSAAWGEEYGEFRNLAPQNGTRQELRLKTDILPWIATIPNVGAEILLGDKWSAQVNVWYCPWKLTDSFSIKTMAIFPEGRWWLRKNNKGSFFNIHLNIAWFNVRANKYRYQDMGRPLLGGGIGYGYRIELNRKWGFEFEIGAGVANLKYDRFFNVANGALKDSRISTYWGIDSACVSITYNLCDL